eukprot:TRINITY_DN18616_c0_g1_i2.p1 TRINITY_DN18616_c0_g1~~TRINITY_DN18616_c0_g1_i2.p1  ORF type:complete len:234 (-),score=44.78 TRINITY_DN18616_c0_g1_i2:77-730(-)
MLDVSDSAKPLSQGLCGRRAAFFAAANVLAGSVMLLWPRGSVVFSGITDASQTEARYQKRPADDADAVTRLEPRTTEADNGSLLLLPSANSNGSVSGVPVSSTSSSSSLSSDAGGTKTTSSTAPGQLQSQPPEQKQKPKQKGAGGARTPKPAQKGVLGPPGPGAQVAGLQLQGHHPGPGCPSPAASSAAAEHVAVLAIGQGRAFLRRFKSQKNKFLG